MGLYDSYPYRNFHELNLDWILKQFKEMKEYLDEVKAELDEVNPKLDDFRLKYPAIAAIAGSNAGGSKNFIYFDDGVPTATTESLGSRQQPLYMDGGILKQGAPFGRIWGPSPASPPPVSAFTTGDVWIQLSEEVVTPPNIRHDIMRFSVVAAGGDHWTALFSLDLTDYTVVPNNA